MAAFEGWAIVELMGHRRLAANLSEATIAGAAFLRLDVPSDPPVTQFYSASAVFSITPTTEELARRVAATHRPTPVSAYELPAPRPAIDQDDEDAQDHEPDDDGDQFSDVEF
jgi:hypothetical protein